MPPLRASQLRETGPDWGDPSHHGYSPSVAKGGSRLITAWCALVVVGGQFFKEAPFVFHWRWRKLEIARGQRHRFVA